MCLMVSQDKYIAFLTTGKLRLPSPQILSQRTQRYEMPPGTQATVPETLPRHKAPQAHPYFKTKKPPLYSEGFVE